MQFALPVLSLLFAALLLGLSARPYHAMPPETCEIRAASVDKSWRIYRASAPRDDAPSGLIYTAEHEGFARECLAAHSCRAFRRAVEWNQVTETIPADDPDYLARVFGLLRRSCGI